MAARGDPTRHAAWNGRHNALVDAPLPDPPPERFGVYPVARGDDRTRIGVLDFDNHGEPPLPWPEVAAQVRPVVAHLQALGHFPLPFRSTGGRGIHVWLVWDAPQKAAAVRALLSSALEACGLEAGDGGVAGREAEVFPKQDAVPADGCGNCVDPPLAGRSVALDPGTLAPLDGAPMLVSSVDLAARDAVPPDDAPRGAQSWDDAVVRSALDAVPPDEYGTWIDVLRALKGGARRARVRDEDARGIAEAWSRRSPRFDAREFAQKWDRGFRKERDGKGRSLGTLYWIAEKHGWVRPAPQCSIARIRRQDSEPPVWLVTLAGYEEHGEILMDDAALTLKASFQRAVLRSRVNQIVAYPSGDQLNQLLQEAEVVPADEDSTTLGRFRARLCEFLDEHLSEERAEIRTGRAWRDPGTGRTWFRWADAESWHRRHRWYDVTHQDALHLVRLLGGGPGTLKLGGGYGSVRAWWVPLDPRRSTPEPPAADLPAPDEGPI